MKINEYQLQAHSFADYTIPVIPNSREFVSVDYCYPVMGLSEEAGEVAGKFAKAIRDCNGKIDNERKEAIVKELGDVTWFVAELCTLLNVSMEEVMQKNIDKLTSRRDRGVIKGEGDDR